MIWRSRRERAMGSGFDFWLMCYFYSMYARKVAGRNFRVKPIFGMPIFG